MDESRRKKILTSAERERESEKEKKLVLFFVRDGWLWMRCFGNRLRKLTSTQVYIARPPRLKQSLCLMLIYK